MPKFVLLEHDHPTLHWDFMVEHGDVLRTWRLDRIPGRVEDIPALPLPDHRRAYLDYEGPVSGNRGTVCRVDRGECEVLNDEPHALSVRLSGKRLSGRADLWPSPASSEQRPDVELWIFHWQPATT